MRNGRVVAVLFLCCLACQLLSAQTPLNKRVSLTYANDYFLATDYYFTQGIALAYTRGDHEYRITQEGYTPTSIAADRILIGDRPYAGALYVSYARKRRAAARGCHATGNCPAWSWALDVGVIGPASLAAAEQKWIHRQTGNIEPRGWQYQIAGDLVLNAGLRLAQPLVNRKYLKLNAEGALAVGTYRSRAELSAPVAIGLFTEAGSAIDLNVFFAPTLRAVAYDASLQGGVFSGGDSPYTIAASKITRGVGILNYGVNIGCGRVGVDFSYTRLGPEFDAGRSHGWGTVRLSYGW